MVTGFWLYYKDSQSRLTQLAASNAANEVVIAQQNSTIDQLKKAEEIRQYVLEKYYEELEAARNEVDTLESRLMQRDSETGQTVEIDEALQNKLEATEDLINREYNTSQKCVSLYSGVNINRLEKDKDAQEKLRRACGLIAR